ncbi:sec-independent protein translocase protein TatB [Microbacterium sp. ZKA21]|uniref:Sec-independent protein translocase subunit TatA/TatB n=1 Tax=Microbacterium sp. ZKA21 TaxID=3381694 RepID=UPI003D22FDEE
MFGLTVEKLFLVALIATVLIGPHRMPQYAGRLAAVLRQLKDMTLEAKRRAEEEAGAAIVREDWQSLDPRRYDPRRIIREAWQDADAAVPVPVPVPVPGPMPVPAPDPVPVPAPDPVPERPSGAAPVPTIEEPDQPEPHGRWVVHGSSAHPRRVWVPADPVPLSILSAAVS